MKKSFIDYYDSRYDQHMYFVGKAEVLLANEPTINKFMHSTTESDYVYAAADLAKAKIIVDINIPMDLEQVDYMQNDWACEV